MLSVQDEENPERKTPIQMSGVSFAVVEKYGDDIYRIALTLTRNPWDAEDIVQDTFFQYFQSHPVFEDDLHEKNWLLRVACNACRNLFRSAWHRKRAEFDWDTLVENANIPGDGTESRVLRAVLELPELSRVAIYLHYYEDYSIAEIAEITGKSKAAVSQQLSRGRKLLRKKLGGALS